jgi:hypothetical protein
LPLGIWLLLGAPALLIALATHFPALAFRRTVSTLGVASLITLPAFATASDGRFYWVFQDNRATFDAALRVTNILRSGPQNGRTIRFWFDLAEPHGRMFLSIGVLYLEEWQGLRELPKWSDQEVRNNLPDNTLLVHLTSEPDKLDAREAQLAKHGIKFGPRRAIPIRASGGTDFFLILQDIHGHSPPAPPDNSSGGRPPDAAQILDSVK